MDPLRDNSALSLKMVVILPERLSDPDAPTAKSICASIADRVVFANVSGVALVISKIADRAGQVIDKHMIRHGRRHGRRQRISTENLAI